TAQLQEAMAKGNEMLQSFRASARAGRNEITGYFGGEQNKVKVEPGFGTGPEDQQFQELFDILADKSTQGTPEELVSQLSNALSDEGLQMFFNYADKRSANAAQYAQLDVLGQGKGIEYRDPQEFRELL